MLDPRRDQPTISFPLSDGMTQKTHSYDTWEDTKSGFWASNKQPKNYRSCHSCNDTEVNLRTEAKVDDESGICSPPLWTRSPPRSPQNRRNYYRSLSPSSKTEAIARGQKELMEMVQNMPESCYELSLKDLVEHPKVVVGEENKGRERNLSNKNVHKREGVNRKGGGKIDSGGFYLKMVFPTSLGSKKNNNNKNKNKNESSVNNSSRVSPRSSVSDGSTKGIDKDWWKKSLSASLGESDSGVSSINSGSMKSSGSSSSNSSSSRSNSRHEISGGDSCWPFIIRRPKSLSQK